MEPLRLIFGLLFAVMSVGVFPVNWPFGHTDSAPSSSLEVSAKTPLKVPHSDSLGVTSASPVIKLASIPTETVLSVNPITPNKFIEDQVQWRNIYRLKRNLMTR